MYWFNKYIAIFLLLVFVRVLIPETNVLALHAHEHTADALEKMDTGFKLDIKHTHCHTDNFFNTPFSPAPKANIKTPEIAIADSYTAGEYYIWKFTFPNNTESRGPPVS